MDNDRREMINFGNWGNFHNIYDENYPKDSVKKKYTSNMNGTKQLAFFQTKSQAALGYVLLDMLNARPNYIAKEVSLEDARDL